MQRVTRGRSGTIRVVFDVDGVPTDPDDQAATLSVTSDAGAVLVPEGTDATSDAGPGAFSYVLEPTATGQYDQLTAAWTATLGGVAQTFETIVEVCGGPLVALTELEDLMIGTGKTTPELVAARTIAEMTIEDLCGVAYCGRYRRETLSGEGARHRDLLLPTPRVTALRSVAIDGQLLADDELADITALEGEGVLHRATGYWPRGVGNIEVSWEHGYRQPHPLASRPVLLLAERLLLADSSGLSNRATSLTNDAGTQLLIVAGVRGMATDIPEVNAFVQNNSSTFGFA